MNTNTAHTSSQAKPLVGHENLLAQNKLGEAYNTIQEGIVEGNVDSFTQSAQNASGPGMTFLLTGLLLVVIIAGIIETGTVFGIVFPSDIVLSATVIALIVLKKWWLVLIAVVLSILFTIVGDQIGYYTGYKLGSNLYEKEDTRYFKKKYIIQAQEALNRSGESFLYKGRFVAFGAFLPLIYGMMKRDRTRFFKVSALSGALWKLSIIVPLVLVLVLFPSLETRFVLLIALAAAIPEIIGWIVLLLPEFKKYKERLDAAKGQIDTLRGNLSNLVETLNTPTAEQEQTLKELEIEQARKQAQMLKKDKERQRRLEAGELTLGEKMLEVGKKAGGAALSATSKLGNVVTTQVESLTTSGSSNKEADKDQQVISPSPKEVSQTIASTTHTTPTQQEKDIKPGDDTPSILDTTLKKFKKFGSSVGAKAVGITHTVGQKLEQTSSQVVAKAKETLQPQDDPDTNTSE